MKIKVLVLLFFCFVNLYSQEDEYIINGSFEDEPKPSSTPDGWKNCGFESEGTIDIHSEFTTFYDVRIIPADGKTCIGLVARENGTYESIGQKLLKPLLKGKVYQIKMQLSRTRELRSHVLMNREKVNYDKPTKMRVYLDNELCNETALIWESELVKNFNWKEFEFTFTPKEDMKFIKLEVFYNEILDSNFYNGNLFVDNLSLKEMTEKKENIIRFNISVLLIGEE